jgi:hypothetical protein
MNARAKNHRIRTGILALVGAALVPVTTGCGPGGIIATMTAIGVAQVIDIASIPYRSLAGTIMLAIINAI